MKAISVEQAKEVLLQNGYFVDNLWHIDDVKSKYQCTDEQAQEILNNSLSGEWITEQINCSIDDEARYLNLPKNQQGFYFISGYYKDDNSTFEDYLVYEYDSCPEDIEEESIFYFGLSETDLEYLKQIGNETNLEFVITSYEKVIESND